MANKNKQYSVFSILYSKKRFNYLKATGVKVGYILNFGHKEKLQYQRIVY